MNMTLETTARFASRLPVISPLATAAADYDVVRRAIAHIRGNWRAQPEIEHDRRRRRRHRRPTCIICSAAGAG